jgi:hypothetical protein
VEAVKMKKKKEADLVVLVAALGGVVVVANGCCCRFLFFFFFPIAFSFLGSFPLFFCSSPLFSSGGSASGSR